MSKMKFCFLLSSLLLCVAAHAQSLQPATDTLLWTTTTYSDSLLNVSGASTASFITYGSNQVKWTPRTSDATNVVFEVTAVEGSWTTGTITWNLTRNNRSRKLTANNNSGTITLIMRWTDAADQPRMLNYTVSELEKLEP